MKTYQVDAHDRIHIIETDHPANRNRIRRNIWVGYILLVFSGLAFIAIYLGRVA